MRTEGDFFTGNLFGEPEPGEQGYLEPGFRWEKQNGNNVLVDAEGNIYDENRVLLKEAPSPALLLARKRHPGLDDADLEQNYVAMYRRELSKNELDKKKDKKETIH